MSATSLVPSALLLCLNVVAQGKPTEITPLPHPVSRVFEWRASDFAYVGRIVDALTGKPIPGAVLHQVPERTRPTGGEFWFVAKWVADEDGFVRVPANELRDGAWFFVDAKGYGPIAAMGYPPGEDGMTRLVPGIDLPVAVHDVLDRPVANVELGACLGCGHTPDVRTATTDAQGIAVLRCMQPTGGVPGYQIFDVYPRGEGLAPDYEEIGWTLDEPPAVLRAEFAAPVRGRVLAPNGRALRGVAVRADTGLHRGPWTTTDVEGRFALLGHKTRELVLFLDEREFLAFLPSTGREFDLVLPAEAQRLHSGGGWARTGSLPASPAGTVTITVKDAISGAPIAGAEVEVWRIGVHTPGDDREHSGVTDEQGRFAARIAAGDVALRVRGPLADGERTPPTHDPENRDLVVKADGELPVQVALQPRVAIAVRVAEGVRGVHLEERCGGGCIDTLVAAGKPVPVPAKAPFAFRIDSEDERVGANGRRSTVVRGGAVNAT